MTSGTTSRTVGGTSAFYLCSTFDLTGDGVPDLVMTRDDADRTVGDDHWAMFAADCR